MKLMTVLLGMTLAVATVDVISSSASADVPTDGLIGYWPGNGNADDLSPTHNNGTFSGSYAIGITGQAFDLATGKVHIPDNQVYRFQNYAGWSVGFWFNTNGISLNASNGEFLGQDIGAGENPKWIIEYGNNNSSPSDRFFLHLNSYGSNPRVFLRSDAVAVPSGWNQLSVVVGSGTVNFYLNGQAIGSDNYTGIIPDTPVDLVFGYLETAYLAGCCQYGGLMDDVAIYNRALTSSEILALATPTPARPIDTNRPYYMSSDLDTAVLPDFRGGTLRVSSSGTISDDFMIENYSGNTIDPHGHMVDFNGTLSGAGGLIINDQVGGGIVIFDNRSNTYTGPTTVNAGTLAVNGSIASSSSLTVNAGGLLVGTGTVPKTTVLAGGTVSPGNGGIGTLRINGNLALASGSTYAVDTTPTANDLLNVTGSARLAGTLAVTPTGTYSYNQTITVVSATGVTGSFDTFVTGNFGFNLVAVLGYGPNSAYLMLEPIAISPLLPAYAPVNETNVAAAIDVAMARDGKRPLFSPLANLSSSDLGNVLSQMSGELANGAAHAGFMIAGSFLETMLDPLVDGRGDADAGASALSYLSNPVRVAFNGPANKTPVANSAPSRPLTFWGAALGGWSNTRGDPTTLGTHSTNASDGALALGADYRPGEGNSVLGLAASIGQTWWDVAGDLGTGHSDVRQVGLYGSTRFDQFYLSGDAALAVFKVRTMRAVTFGGASLYAAKFNAQSEGGRLELGRRFVTDDEVGLTPYIGLQAMQFRSPNYVETTVSGSAPFALAYSKKTQSNVTHDIGIQADDLLSVGTEARIDLHVRAGWLHYYSASLSEQVAFNAFPDAMFVVHGVSQAKDAARVSIGMDAGIADGLSFLLKVQSDLSSTWQTYNGSAKLAYRW